MFKCTCFSGHFSYIPCNCIQLFECHILCSRVACSGPSQECCYDSAGNLHTNSPGGGSVNRFGSATMDSQSDHHLFDLFPYVHCCKGELRSCSNYYEVRPSDLGRNFFPPLPGAYLWHIASSCIILVSCLNLYACTCVHTYNMP